jgi:phosphoribosylformimino-5-aminoimidazole carboxamide ribonucleotide (ProFAR) isomerase
MGFHVIPAIDVSGGRLARMGERGPEPVGAFGGDPLAAARAFVAAGARWLHVVDLDLAFEGVARNLVVVQEVAALGAAVQASGGVVTEVAGRAMLDAGASRVVLGSAALGDRAVVTALIEELGDRVAVGIEVQRGRVRPRGRSGVDLPLEETIAWVAKAGAALIVVTAVASVGSLGGPDVEVIRRVASLTRLPIVAGGGVSDLADLLALAALPVVEGAIVGRAALEGRVDIAAAMAALP